MLAVAPRWARTAARREVVGGGVVLDDRRVARGLPLLLASLYADLNREQLVEGETVARLDEPVGVVGVVHLAHRLDDGHQAVALAHLLGQRILEAARVRFEELRDHVAEGALRQALRQVVDRHQPARVACATFRVEAFELGVLERGAAAVDRDLAGDRDLGAAGASAR